MRKQDAVLARAERDKWKRFLNSIKCKTKGIFLWFLHL